jgi:hypothetical protein
MMTTPPPDRGLHSLVRALAPDAITPDLTARLRSLADDLDRIAAGEAPTATDLAQAPLLVDWRLMLTWAGVGLVGFAAGHPVLGSKTIATSPVWALDPALRWARTLSRFYRLGVPAGGAIPRGENAASGDAQP